jgi:hypothetical protein
MVNTRPLNLGSGRTLLSSHFEIGVAGRFRTVGRTKMGPIEKPADLLAICS